MVWGCGQGLQEERLHKDSTTEELVAEIEALKARIAALEGGHASDCSFIDNPGNGMLMPGESCPGCGYKSPSMIVTSGRVHTDDEITPAMIEAGYRAFGGYEFGSTDYKKAGLAKAYRAMEAAK